MKRQGMGLTQVIYIILAIVAVAVFLYITWNVGGELLTGDIGG